MQGTTGGNYHYVHNAERGVLMTKRVLVVDDDDGVRQIIQLSLEAVAGWNVMVASSGREGMAIAQSQALDLILLDVMMPDEDGIEVLHNLKSHPITKPIPTIFLTAKAQASECQQFMELGVQGVIIKPFQARELAHQINRLLDW